jgi:ribosomal-protein-alanine N-acetyltransferase
MTAETARLSIRALTLADAPFVLRLVNEPAWLKYIGDKQVHSLAEAEHYIRTGPADTQRRFGFALNLVLVRDGALPIGICGLVKRETLPDPDLGFAFLEEHWGRGYAVEAAAAVVDHARTALKLSRLLAITSPDNQASGRVLEKLGFVFERFFRFPDERGEELKLYVCRLATPHEAG